MMAQANHVETDQTNERWIFDQDPRSKLLNLGVFGIDNGLEDLEAVVQNRHARLPELVSRLRLQLDDLVVDLGSGMGFVAEVVAPLVHTLYCVDISPTFLADTRARLDAQEVRNVEYVLTDYADFSGSFHFRVSKIYSLLLFIHFNYFDFLYYLVECNRILLDGGLLYFDFNDGDRFTLGNPADSFSAQIPLYKPNRKEWIFNCMHMGSLTLLRNVAPQLGFEFEATYHGTTCHSQALLRKVADAPDLELRAAANGYPRLSPERPSVQHADQSSMRQLLRRVKRALERLS